MLLKKALKKGANTPERKATSNKFITHKGQKYNTIET